MVGIDNATIIKQTVTMPMLLAIYGYDTPYGRRIPCPLHNGEKKNFSYKDNSYRCYVCGSKGTVIDFVMELFHLSFHDAMRKIDADLHMGLYDEDESARSKVDALVSERLERKRKREAERKRLHDAYQDALDRWVEADLITLHEAPQTPWDDFTDRYGYAVRDKSIIEEQLIQTEIELYNFEHMKEGA